MWVKVDDRLPRHAKIVAAGLTLGKDGARIALGMYVWGLAYAAENLTDGFIPHSAIDGNSNPERERKIADALVKAVVKPHGFGLWEAVPGGWRIHDYHDHNPHADEVAAKRDKDRGRKEIERRKKLGLAPVSEGCPRGQGVDAETEQPSVSEGCPRGQVAPESEKSLGVSEVPRARAHTSRVSVPSRPVPSEYVPSRSPP